jgi:hypothetical protein
VGTKDGAALAARFAQLAFDENCAILSLDIANAFNSIPRAVVDDGVRTLDNHHNCDLRVETFWA